MNKIALITGATSGIGKSCAEKFAANKYDLILTGRRSDRLENIKSEVEKIWKQGKVVIFDVDVKGGISLKKYFGEKALSIFIEPPSIEELERRLISRDTDDAETIKTRVAKAEEEMTYASEFDKIVINEDLDAAKIEIESLIKSFISN